MIPSERLKGIEVFVCVADAGSFTAAADRLSLSASAVGKSVARLEDRVGARLFERSTRRLALTDAGAAFHRTCVRVLDELQEAEAALAAQRRSRRAACAWTCPPPSASARSCPCCCNSRAAIHGCSRASRSPTVSWTWRKRASTWPCGSAAPTGACRA